ncbi:MAG: tetraacyldisaccharide 4'-kinase [bacterium]
MILKVLSFFYGLGTETNRFIYKTGLKKTRKMPGFVISAGNISAGGAGKTSFVMELCRLLEKERKTAVITRGYKGSVRGPEIVTGGSKSIEKFGDEAVMMTEKLVKHGIPVIVSKNREEGIKFACEKLGRDTFILDDAFQNFSVKKDRDILLIDAVRPWGGLLRDWKASMKRAGIIIVSRANLVQASEVEKIRKEISKYSHAPLIESTLSIKTIKNIYSGNTAERAFFRQKKTAAFCGIGNPSSFEKLLIDNGIEPEKFIVFGDHHRYGGSDIAKLDENYLWLTTEKDAVKVRNVAVRRNIFALVTQTGIDDDKIKHFIL